LNPDIAPATFVAGIAATEVAWLLLTKSRLIEDDSERECRRRTYIAQVWRTKIARSDRLSALGASGRPAVVRVVSCQVLLRGIVASPAMLFLGRMPK